MHEFVINDHLGNGRVWFIDQDNNGRIDQNEESNEVVEIKEYYPFDERPIYSTERRIMKYDSDSRE